MKFVIAGTGASGAAYLQRLLDHLEGGPHEVHLVLSVFAKQVVHDELGELRVPDTVRQHSDRSLNVPFASGSALFDAMVVLPCSMGTLGRIAAGISDTLITRTADVFLKERRKLILVPRETPWNLIHARNCAQLLEAGIVLIPAMPSFYARPQTVTDLVDTVVHRVLDQMGVPAPNAFRWQESRE